MARPEDASPARPNSAPAHHGLIPLILLLATLGAASILVFHRALGYFFSQDDFAGLARARGLLPSLVGPWRFLSGQTYFDVMRSAAGLDPILYHVVSLVAHAACSVVLFFFLARYAGRPAAWVASVFFAVHRAHYTAIYSISGIGEILATLFGLLTLLFASTAGRVRWAAAPLFMLSLLCKESTVLLPLVALLVPVPPSPGHPVPSRSSRVRFRDPLILTMIALSAIYVVTFVARDAFGIRQALPEREPYALAFDANLIRNLLTYLGWTINFLVPTVRTYADDVDPAVFGYGIAGAALWLVGLERKHLRARGWLAGGALFLAMLLPVLPLRNHTYHYYLYGPLAGAAWCLALLVDYGASAASKWLRPRPTPARRDARASRKQVHEPKREPVPSASAKSTRPLAWAGATAIGVGLTVNGILLVRKVETNPVVIPASPIGKEVRLRRDPTVDRAIIAENVFRDLRQAALPTGARLLFWCPGMKELQRSMGRDTTQETYLESNVRIALLDGLAIRVLFPALREADFIRTLSPATQSEAYAVYGLDGHLRVVPAAQHDSLRNALLQNPMLPSKREP